VGGAAGAFCAESALPNPASATPATNTVQLFIPVPLPPGAERRD
jgi:hypothetical protein